MHDAAAPCPALLWALPKIAGSFDAIADPLNPMFDFTQTQGNNATLFLDPTTGQPAPAPALICRSRSPHRWSRAGEAGDRGHRRVHHRRPRRQRHRATFTLTLTTPSAFSIGGILAYAESPTPDPDLFNNFGVALIITS